MTKTSVMYHLCHKQSQFIIRSIHNTLHINFSFYFSCFIQADDSEINTDNDDGNINNSDFDNCILNTSVAVSESDHNSSP